MNEDIAKAKKLLVDNGYVIKKWTYSMEQDSRECEKWKKRTIKRLLWM